MINCDQFCHDPTLDQPSFLVNFQHTIQWSRTFRYQFLSLFLASFHFNCIQPGKHILGSLSKVKFCLPLTLKTTSTLFKFFSAGRQKQWLEKCDPNHSPQKSKTQQGFFHKKRALRPQMLHTHKQSFRLLLPIHPQILTKSQRNVFGGFPGCSYITTLGMILII